MHSPDGYIQSVGDGWEMGLGQLVSEVQGLQYNLLIEILGAAERRERKLVKSHRSFSPHKLYKECLYMSS